MNSDNSFHALQLPGWKGLCRVCTVHNEIVDSCETPVYGYWHTHGMPFYAPATWSTMNEIDTRVPCVLHCVSHLLCAVLALGRATYNMLNSMFDTPGKCMWSTHYHHVQKGRAMMCITHNFRVVRHVNIADFPQISMNIAANAWTFLPGYRVSRSKNL